MKKWGALTVILLLGVILALQYFLGKKEAGVKPPPSAPGGSENVGVALPESPAATAYDAQNSFTMPAADGVGPLPTIRGEIYQKGECKDGSLNDILSSHGRIWGHYLETAGFSSKQNSQTQDMLSKYFACVSLAERSALYCDHLPGAGLVGDKKITFENSLNYLCREAYKEIAVVGFLTGNSKDNSPVMMMIADGDISEIPSLSAGDFVAAASKGMGMLCSSIAKHLTPEQLKECNADFPSGKDSCRGNTECLQRYELYKALESGKLDKCPESQKDLCRAYLSKTDSACAGPLKELSGAYCKNLAQLMKTTNGLAGLTQAEITERFKKEASERVENEKNRKEQERINKDINKEIRAMKGN